MSLFLSLTPHQTRYIPSYYRNVGCSFMLYGSDLPLPRITSISSLLSQLPSQLRHKNSYTQMS